MKQSHKTAIKRTENTSKKNSYLISVQDRSETIENVMIGESMYETN